MYFKLVWVIILVLLAAACKKQDLTTPPVPVAVDTTAYLQLTAQNIAESESGMYAIISLVDPSGDTAVNNRKIAITRKNQQYLTEQVPLKRGNYSLVKFIVVKASDTALYAVPQKQSSKSSLVTNPLPVTMEVKDKGLNAGSIHVVPVSSADMPTQYGYTISDFGFVPYFHLSTYLQMKVGEVIYDSLPGILKVEAVDAQGVKWIREQSLKAGATIIHVPANYQSYNLHISKWNTIINKHFTQHDLQNGMQVKLYGEKVFKKILQEQVFVENGYDMIPENRSVFFYNTNGTLKEIRFYQRSLTISGLPLNYVYQFQYSQSHAWDTMFRYDAQQALTGYTSMDRSGSKITAMYQKSYDQQTGVAVSYSAVPSYDLIQGDYVFHNGNTLRYSMKFHNGNKVQDQAQSSTGGAESSTYGYDHEINPYHQLGYDDLFFTNASKNNITSVHKGYSGNIPSVVPYKYEYLYDADGYPKELFISYKGYTSQQHLYRIKKVFMYQ